MNVFCLNRTTFKLDLTTFQIPKQAYKSDVNLSQLHNTFKSRNGVKLTSKIMAVSLKIFWSAWVIAKNKFTFFSETTLQEIFVPSTVLPVL